MEQYISKDALVAKIERRKQTWQHQDKQYVNGGRDVCDYLLGFLDTLEVKEVDLDTNFGVCWGEYCDCGGNINDYEIAKHFFELGIAVSNKAQKGE